MGEESRTLRICLKKISDNSWKELEDGLSKYSGITCPGLDVPSKILEMTYEPKIISKKKILGLVKKLGYEFGFIQDFAG